MAKRNGKGLLANDWQRPREMSFEVNARTNEAYSDSFSPHAYVSVATGFCLHLDPDLLASGGHEASRRGVS